MVPYVIDIVDASPAGASTRYPVMSSRIDEGNGPYTDHARYRGRCVRYEQGSMRVLTLTLIRISQLCS